MKPFPWLAFSLLLVWVLCLGILTYCLWHEIGPRSWYEEDKMPLGKGQWVRLASGGLPLTCLFLSLIFVGVPHGIRPRIHDMTLNHVLLAIQLLGGICFALSALAAASLYYSAKPQHLMPPVFRKVDRP